MVDLNTSVYHGVLYNKPPIQAALEKASMSLTHIQKVPCSHTLCKFFLLNHTLTPQAPRITENPMYLDKMK